jgi:hypothetical protein
MEVGLEVGEVGSTVGELTGAPDGFTDGVTVGPTVGYCEGPDGITVEGCPVGNFEGRLVGKNEGVRVGV